MPDEYQDSLDFLYSRLNYERQGMPRLAGELRLGRMRRLLRRLGDPQDAFKIVHVAGTKGKGSTSAMIAAGLTSSGMRTGLFCSPHLDRLEERFKIDGVDATPDQFVALIDTLRPIVATFDAEGTANAHRGPTFFEITTAIGLLHFARSNADAVVLEVGLGGRLDSTNVIRPAVSVITNISYDHVKQLGNTLGAIAREKAGIFKRGRPAVSGEMGSEARGVIRKIAKERRAPFREITTDFLFEYEAPMAPLKRPTAGRVHVRTWRTDWGMLELPLLGSHQAHNASVALATIDVLGEQGIEVGRDAVIRAFLHLTFPARVEVLGSSPWIVIDGAHNLASAQALAATLRDCIPPVSRTLVFGTTREKDMKGQLRVLLPGSDRVVATQYVENPRAVPPGEVAEAVAELGGPAAILTYHPAEAIAAARAITPQEGLICVTGSLFLAAETRALIRGQATAVSVN